jgi:hypothetical protein
MDRERAGLPDGIGIFKPKIPIWVNLEGPMKRTSHWEYITAVLYISWAFGKLMTVWYIFPLFWYILSSKIWQP